MVGGLHDRLAFVVLTSMSSVTKSSDAVGVREDSAADKAPSSISLTSLNVQQLSDVKKQLEDELKHLTTSFASLKSAQVKFTSCIENIDSLTEASAFVDIQRWAN